MVQAGHGTFTTKLSLCLRNLSLSEDTSSGSSLRAKRYVEQALRSQATADFTSMFSDLPANVIHNGGRCYKVRLYVDAQNGNSAMIWTKNRIFLQQADENSWKLVELEM